MAERLGFGLQRETDDPYYTAPNGQRYLVNGVSIQVDPNQFTDPTNRFMDQATWDKIRNDPTLMITTPDGKQAFREDLMMEIAKTLPSSGINNDNHNGMFKGLAMIGGLAGAGALMAGAGGVFTGGLGGEILGGAGGFGGELGTAALGELGSGTYGLTGTNGLNTLTGNLLDPAVTGTNVFGDVIGTTGATTAGAGSTVVNTVFNPLDPTTWGDLPKVPPGGTQLVDKIVDGVNEGGLDGPLGDSPGNYTDGMGTDNPLTTGGDTPNWLERILNGIAKETDWTKLLAAAGGGLFDYLGDQAAGDKSMELWNAIQNSPGMTRFNNSFSDGWNIMDADPSFQGALDASANAFTRAASAKVGNVGGNPGAWNEIQTNVMNSTLAPWTTNYRAQNLNAAGIAANSVQPFVPSMVNSAGSGWDNAGAFLGSMYKPQNGFSIGNDGKITWNSGSAL